MEGVHVAFLTQATHYIYIVCKMPDKTSTAFHINLGTAVSITITLVITSAVQSFYAWRVYRLSAGYRSQKPLVGFILATSLSQLCTGLTANALQFVSYQLIPTHTQQVSHNRYGFPSLSVMREPLPRISYTASLGMTITCDLTISASLVYFLNNMRTGFKS
ncbi:hypothetical protein C0995_003075, partial [Termitomyces sp. Mi166